MHIIMFLTKCIFYNLLRNIEGKKRKVTLQTSKAGIGDTSYIDFCTLFWW